MMFKEVDHTICGAPCKKVPVPKGIEELNNEHADFFPDNIPGGLPPKRFLWYFFIPFQSGEDKLKATRVAKGPKR